MANPWDSDPEVSSQIPTQNPWDKDPEVTAAPVISPPVGSRLTALLQGFGQGATLGILPYMQAGASYALQGLTPSASSPNWSNTLADVKAQQAQIAQQQPGAYMGGNIVGGVVPAVLTGGESLLGRGALGTVEGLGTRVATSTIGRNIAAGGVQGAAGAETPSDILSDALIGGTISGTTTGLLGGVGNIGSYIKNTQGRTALADALEAATETKNGVITPQAQQIQNAVTRDAIAGGSFGPKIKPVNMSDADFATAKSNAAIANTNRWFGQAVPAQPISFMGSTIQPGEVGYDEMVEKIAQQTGQSVSGQPQGSAYTLINQLRDKTFSPEQISASLPSYAKNQYGVLNRTVNNYTETQPGFIEGATKGAKQTLPKLAVDLGLGALGYSMGGVPGAVIGAGVPILGMAGKMGIQNIASKGAAKSFANLLSNNAGSTAGQVLGQAGGYMGRIGNQSFTDIVLNSPLNQQ